MKHCIAPIATLLLAVTAATGVKAEDIGQHPAIFAPRALPGVNPSTFIVGHPASPTNRAGHANFEHPAVVAARAAAAVDVNVFLVQPPASVVWTLAPSIDQPVALK
jgi:hypothetical protein